MSTVLIAGCGDLGIRLGLKLAKNHTVYGVRRQANKISAPIRPIMASLLQKDLAILPPASTVFFTVSADEFSDESYQKNYCIALENLIEHFLKTQMPERFLFISSTAVYGDAGGEWVDEMSPLKATHFSGKRLIEAESYLANLANTTIICRLSGIYGRHPARLIDSLLKGELKRSAKPTYTNRIHIDDAVDALIHIANLPEPEKVYLVTDDKPALNNTVIEWLCEKMHLPLPEIANETSTKRPEGNRQCSNQRLKQSGYHFHYPTFVEGYANAAF